MAKKRLTPEFREFLECLNRARVEYLLGGGYAVNLYGCHRFTEDIGFGIAVGDDLRASKLASARYTNLADLERLPEAWIEL